MDRKEKKPKRQLRENGDKNNVERGKCERWER